MATKLDVSNQIATITLNRPEKRNALNDVLVAELHQHFHQLSVNKEVKAILLRAEGPAFCAGADLAYLQELAGFSAEQNLEDSRRLKDCLLAIWNCPKPVIAAVQGPAVAGGCGLVSVADYVIAADKVIFGYPETRIGFAPAIVMVFMAKKISRASAWPLLQFGNTFSATRAHEIGLVNEVVEEGVFMSRVEAFLNEILTSNSQNSLEETKNLWRNVTSSSLEAELEEACQVNMRVRQSPDFAKGVSAVLEKQKINWN